MSLRLTARGRQIWGARASRVLVSALCRNSLFVSRGVWSVKNALRKVRDRGDAFASMRDACAPQTANGRSIKRSQRPSA